MAQSHQDTQKVSVRFILTKWLIQPHKSAANRHSGLPIVVLDDECHRYRVDKDYVDRLAPTIWPVSSVELVPVTILPLDKSHSVPVDIKIDASMLSKREIQDGLLRYGIQPTIHP